MGRSGEEPAATTALRGLCVVAVTADVEFPSKATAAGFDGVLLKPVTADKLAALLRVPA